MIFFLTEGVGGKRGYEIKVKHSKTKSEIQYSMTLSHNRLSFV